MELTARSPESRDQSDILIVDDVPENVQLLYDVLDERGYDVRRTINGPQALNAARTDPPDLILLDIMMPGMDGFEVCSQLQADPATAEIPIIFLSALDQSFDRVRAFEVGGRDYITKPFHLEEAIARIENQLTIARQQRQLQQEIRDRRAIEIALRSRENQYRTLVETAQGVIWAVDAQGRYTFVNQAAKQAYGYEPEEMIDRSFTDFLLPSEIPKQLSIFRELLHKKSFSHFQNINVAKSGKLVHLLCNAVTLYDPHGNVAGITGTSTNITLLKQAELLQQTHNRILTLTVSGAPLREILYTLTQQVDRLASSLRASIWLVNPEDGSLRPYVGAKLPPSVFDNLAPDVIACATEETLRRRTIIDDIESDPAWEPYRDWMLSQGIQACWSEPIVSQDGQTLGKFVLYLTQARSPSCKEEEIQTTVARQTAVAIEHKYTENALRQSEQLLRESQRLAKVGGWWLDCRTGKVVLTEQVYRIYELDNCQVEPKLENWDFYLSVFPDEARSQLEGAFQRLLKWGEPYDLEVPLVTAKGNPRWIRTTAQAIRNDSEVIEAIGSLIDISDRKHDEQRLRQREASLQEAQQLGKIGSWSYDVISGKIEWSDEAFRIYGLDPEGEEPSYPQLLSLVHPDDRDEFQHNVTHAISAGREYEHEVRLIRPDGSIVYTLGRGRVQRDKSGRVVHLFGIVQDISDRKLVEESLRIQSQRERTLNEVIRAIRQSLELSEIFATAVREIGELLQVQRVDIVQYLPKLHQWIYVAEYLQDNSAPNYLKRTLPDRNNASVQQLRHQEMVFIDDLDTIDDSIDRSLDPNHSSWLLVPLKLDSRLWGCLSLARDRPCPLWQDADVRLAQTVADQLAIAIQQSELYSRVQHANQELERLATLDGLTQVANRRRFDDYLEREWRRLARERSPLALIMSDVDFFKCYNDTYEHQAGDECLKQVAATLNQAIQRAADLVARYGGEEFAAILPNTDLDGAYHIAETVRAQVEALQLEHRHSEVSAFVTLSLGVASQIPDPNGSPASLIRLADQALYRAKQQGRNRVVCL